MNLNHVMFAINNPNADAQCKYFSESSKIEGLTLFSIKMKKLTAQPI
jgi:hypothetical protein